MVHTCVRRAWWSNQTVPIRTSIEKVKRQIMLKAVEQLGFSPASGDSDSSRRGSAEGAQRFDPSSVAGLSMLNCGTVLGASVSMPTSASPKPFFAGPRPRYKRLSSTGPFLKQTQGRVPDHVLQPAFWLLSLAGELLGTVSTDHDSEGHRDLHRQDRSSKPNTNRSGKGSFRVIPDRFQAWCPRMRVRGSPQKRQAVFR